MLFALLSPKDRTWSNIFLWIAASKAAAVNPNGIKKLLASGLSTFFIKDNPVISERPKSLPKNPLNYPILCNWVFLNDFILPEELFAKALSSLETCVLVNNNLYRKLFSLLELPTRFDEIFRVTSAPFFSPDFNLLNCELDNFMFKVLYWVILY